MSKKFRFDQASVDALEKREKEWFAWDEGLAGFGVRILASGTKSWIVSEKKRQEDGKVRSHRIKIGRLPEMSLEEARAKAREILGEAAGVGVDEAAGGSPPAEGAAIPASQDDGQVVEESETVPDGGNRATSVSPASEATAEPDRLTEPSPNDAAAEEEPGAVEEAEAASAATTSAGVEDNPETGETLPAGAEVWEDADEGLDAYDEIQLSQDTGRHPEAVPDGEADRQAMEVVLSRTMDGTTGGGAADPYGEVAETAGRAERSRMPRVESEGGTGAEGGGEAGAAGGDPDGDVDAGESEARDRGRGEDEAGETEAAARQRPGRARKAFGIATGMAGKVVEGGRTLITKKAEGSPVQEEPAKAARDEPESGPPAGGKVEAGETDGSEGSDEPKLEARKQTTAGVEEESRDGKALSDETVAGLTESVASLARNLDGMRVVTDRIEAWHVKMGPQMEQLTGSTAVIAGDRRQGRRRRARMVLAMAAVLTVGIGGGIAIQSRVEVAPQADPTLGWKDHVWEYYGETIKGCFQRAKKTESGYADCAVKVRGR